MGSNNESERQRIIDENLKKVFGETVEEGIPDRFKDLLEKLKQQDPSKGAKR